MAGENFWINVVPVTGKCIFRQEFALHPQAKSPPCSHQYKAEERYSPKATFFRKSILIIRKREGNYALTNYCKGTTIRISS